MNRLISTALPLLLALCLLAGCGADRGDALPSQAVNPPVSSAPAENPASSEGAFAEMKPPASSDAQEASTPSDPAPSRSPGEPPSKAAPSGAASPGGSSSGSASSGGADVPQEEPAAPTCTLTVHCGTLLDHLEDMEEAKRDLVPSDGVLWAEQTVSFTEGESVFDVLLREMQSSKTHLEYVNTPFYHSAYSEGIGNLYEFDGGPLSGWVYSVNGEFPNYGSSRYTLQDGDSVVWQYTCDLGADVGGDNGAWS